jgi:hypothetical protein
MSDAKSLQVLVDEVSQIEQMLLEGAGEITPELEAMLAVSETFLPQKIDNYSLVIERMRFLTSFYKSRAEFVLKMSKAAEAVAERCRDNLKLAMETLQTEELVGIESKFKLVKSNPTCVVEDEAQIDESYKSVETFTKIDKKRIAEDLKIGVPVRGARLEYNRSLRSYANTPNRKAVSK